MFNILVVDDDVCLRLILSEYLEAAGYCCTLAENVSQARKHLSRGTFDLVISDVNMPGESGFDLLSYVTSRYFATTFLLMSAMDDVNSKKRALQMGACDYLVKPFRLSQLHAIISNVAQQCSRPSSAARIRQRLERSVFSVAQKCSRQKLQIA